MICVIAKSEKSEKEWEVVMLNTLSIILKEGIINKRRCMALAEIMFDELMRICENTKALIPEMFLIVKIISHVAAYYDTDELILTKKLLNFIFQSLIKTSFGKCHVSDKKL